MKDLNVTSDNIQRVYKYYLDRKLIVNRRYQRKLVWTIDEKAAFIDSIMKSYPVPLILLAESGNEKDIDLEIIDGMQRLNAIVSFIENEFPVNGKYFDLETMAETKLLLDTNKIKQKEPILDRVICSDIAGYLLPMSTYRGANAEEIDEVFRRINANGKHLSRQEIRQAGAISNFADMVRKISSEIRGDTSLTDKVELNKMAMISVTSRDLDYGINVDEVFWVKNAIISREQVRESKDEEIIADIIATILSDEIPASNSNILDDYYSLKGENKRASEIENRILLTSIEKTHDDFIKVYDLIKSILNFSEQSFNSLISSGRSFSKVPRYFEIIFLALYNIMIKQNKKLTSISEISASLNGITNHIRLSQGGGNWSAKERETNISAVVGIIQNHFVENLDDPATVLWSTQLETILQQSKTEQTCFDFKLGFYNKVKREFNDDVLCKILLTLTAMANAGKNSIGYVIVGVADKKTDSDKLVNIDEKYKPVQYHSYYVTGVNFDIDMFGKGEDKFYQYIVNKIQKIDISESYKKDILNNIKFLDYGGKMVLIFKVQGLSEPAMYENEYYQRSGANVEKIPTKDFIPLMQRFIQV
ncbi:DUF262 domain-containing protein [Ruminococcus sp. NK3A76]|uniref:GmrSD restriction endonuclease domain-containing protein n=1 Tax=Ruminococcus sp. NK3A76 TaxID=877411 RepID=UPI000567A981|nr:DUF262 domain-containing protein [Ruminococcus sp. NK3A76]